MLQVPVLKVTGRFGAEPFWPWVDSALGRFGPVWWVVSAYFFSTIRLVTEGQLNTFLASWRVHGSW